MCKNVFQNEFQIICQKHRLDYLSIVIRMETFKKGLIKNGRTDTVSLVVALKKCL